MLDELNTLARDVMKYGFSWVEDGPAIQKMSQLARDAFAMELGAYWPTLTKEQRQAIVLGEILGLATLYKWDAQNMGPLVEAAFLKYIVDFYVS